MTLKELPVGKTATVQSVGGEGALRQHLLDMGLIPGADVTMVKFAPMGDPLEVRIHGYELTLRLADAEKIKIENVRETAPERRRNGRGKSTGSGWQSGPAPGGACSGRLFSEWLVYRRGGNRK